MADVYWQGDVSSDPTVAGNWSTAAVPQAGDDVIFDGTATALPDGGNLAGNAVGSIVFDSTYSFTTASSGTPLQFQLAADGTVDIRCSGTHYLDIDESLQVNVTGGATVYLVGLNNDSLRVNGSGATVEVGVAGTPAEFDDVILDKGTATIIACEDQAGGGAAFDLYVNGGTAKVYDAVDDARQTGGKWYQYDEPIDDPTILGGTFYHMAGGTVATDGKIDGTLIIRGGTVDLSKSYLPFTIDAMTVGKGSTFRDPHGRVTYTAAPQFPASEPGDSTREWGPHVSLPIARL